jgi:hypothetical protein
LKHSHAKVAPGRQRLTDRKHEQVRFWKDCNRFPERKMSSRFFTFG